MNNPFWKVAQAAVAALALLTALPAQAAPLSLVSTEPDIGGQISFGYVYTDALTGQCSSNNGSTGPCGGGFKTPIPDTPGSGQLTIDDLSNILFYTDAAIGADNDPFGGDLQIISNFDEFGAFLDGTLSITITGGAIPGITGPTIVSGDIFNFGFSGTGNGGNLEFETTITGGDWLGTSITGVAGTIAGITISGGTIPIGTWDSSMFTSSFSGTNSSQDTFTTAAVPLPAAVWLFGSGLFGLVAVARRKNRNI